MGLFVYSRLTLFCTVDNSVVLWKHKHSQFTNLRAISKVPVAGSSRLLCVSHLIFKTCFSQVDLLILYFARQPLHFLFVVEQEWV